MQPQVLELKDIHYLSKLVNGIYILAKNYRWFIIIFHTAKGEKNRSKSIREFYAFILLKIYKKIIVVRNDSVFNIEFIRLTNMFR